jgi:hypothetical protein
MPRQRVRVSETWWRSRWNEPLNVNVKNTGVESFFVDPLRVCQPVPGKHTVLSDALVPSIYPTYVRLQLAVETTVANLPAIRRVYNLVCLCIVYGYALCIQVRERKKENKRGCEKGRESKKCRHLRQARTGTGIYLRLRWVGLRWMGYRSSGRQCPLILTTSH